MTRFIMHNLGPIEIPYFYIEKMQMCRINIGVNLYLNVPSTAAQKSQKTKRSSGALGFLSIVAASTWSPVFLGHAQREHAIPAFEK